MSHPNGLKTAPGAQRAVPLALGPGREPWLGSQAGPISRWLSRGNKGWTGLVGPNWLLSTHHLVLPNSPPKTSLRSSGVGSQDSVALGEHLCCSKLPSLQLSGLSPALNGAPDACRPPPPSGRLSEDGRGQALHLSLIPAGSRVFIIRVIQGQVVRPAHRPPNLLLHRVHEIVARRASVFPSTKHM